MIHIYICIYIWYIYMYICIYMIMSTIFLWRSAMSGWPWVSGVHGVSSSNFGRWLAWSRLRWSGPLPSFAPGDQQGYSHGEVAHHSPNQMRMAKTIQNTWRPSQTRTFIDFDLLLAEGCDQNQQGIRPVKTYLRTKQFMEGEKKQTSWLFCPCPVVDDVVWL